MAEKLREQVELFTVNVSDEEQGGVHGSDEAVIAVDECPNFSDGELIIKEQPLVDQDHTVKV
jgi:hypothetical protein